MDRYFIWKDNQTLFLSNLKMKTMIPFSNKHTSKIFLRNQIIKENNEGNLNLIIIESQNKTNKICRLEFKEMKNCDKAVLAVNDIAIGKEKKMTKNL